MFSTGPGGRQWGPSEAGSPPLCTFFLHQACGHGVKETAMKSLCEVIIQSLRVKAAPDVFKRAVSREDNHCAFKIHSK